MQVLGFSKKTRGRQFWGMCEVGWGAVWTVGFGGGEAGGVWHEEGQQNLTGLSLDGTEQGDLCLPPYSSSSLGCAGTGLNPGAVSGQGKVSAAGPVPTGGLNSTLGTRNVLVGRRLGEAGFPPRQSRVRGLGACAVCAAPGLGQSHRDIPLAAPAAGGWHLCEE